MKMYAVYTPEGTGTIVANNKRDAYEQAYAIWTEVTEIEFVTAL